MIKGWTFSETDRDSNVKRRYTSALPIRRHVVSLKHMNTHTHEYAPEWIVIQEAGWISGIAISYGLDDRGFKSRQGLGIFLFTTASRLALGPTQPPIQWVSRALSLRVNRPGREADHSPPSSAQVKTSWSYTSTPSVRLHGVVLS
jgi:hypothetical protein